MRTITKLIVAVSVAVILIFAGVMIVWKMAESKTLLPDRAPADVEENAVIDKADSEKMDIPPNGGGASFNYAKEITIDMSTGTAELYFENSGSALYDASLVLVIDDTVILESGLLPPGSRLTTLSFPKDSLPLQRGGYDAALWVQSYDEDGNALNVNFQLQGIRVEVK